MIRTSLKASKSDEQLIAEYKLSGDPQIIEVLFNRYCHLVFAVAMKYLQHEEESKDAVIEIFLKVPEDIRKYRIEKFSNWIYIVTRNYSFHLLKKKTGLVHEENMDDLQQEKEPEPIDEADLNRRLANHIQESLESLNEEQRACIQLFYLEEKSYGEIERITGYSYNQVKSFIQNGKRNLRIFLSRFLK